MINLTWQPDDREIAIIREHNNTAAAKLLGRSKQTIRHAREQLGIPNPGAVGPEATARREEAAQTVGIPSIWPIPEDPPVDFFKDDLWLTLESLQQQMQDLDTEVAEVNVTVADDKPIMVVFFSDLHIGHTQCNMALLRHDLDLIKNTPGLYVVMGGDLADNVVTAVSGRGMFHEQLAPIRIQQALIDRMCGYVTKDKTLAMLLGNHEGWSLSSADYDPIAYIAQKIGCAYLGAHGFVNVTLGGETYKILTAHQFRMRSSFNLTHQAKRLEDFMGEADVTFTGHTHEGSGENTKRRNKKRFYGQAGTYLQSSRYGKTLGFAGASAEMPGVILWPGRKKFIGFNDAFDDGITHLNALRRAS